MKEKMAMKVKGGGRAGVGGGGLGRNAPRRKKHGRNDVAHHRASFVSVAWRISMPRAYHLSACAAVIGALAAFAQREISSCGGAA